MNSTNMPLQCLHCRTVNSSEARYCRECGQPLTQAAATTPPGDVPAQATSTQQAPPPAAGYSVLTSLKVGKPPGAPFWVGLVGLGFTGLCCPAGTLLLVLSADSSQIDDPAGFRMGIVSVAACLFVLGLASSAFFLFLGRPRRAA